ncbi:MAG: hypothetical protein JOY80_01685, partial [Candidatus Dormibacteraeota bacterium]|nr:hypothetical protein [Candidatus Dormibacteraeota bacterium]
VLFDDLLIGLDALHDAQVNHGDVRPGSVVVDGDGTVRLIDAAVPEPSLRPDGNPGTPQYMAPELWSGAPPSVASDLYGASAVLFEALSGGPPFANRDLAGLRRAHEEATVPDAGLPAVARGLLAQGLAKDPAARPAGAGRFRQDLSTAGAAFLEDGWRSTGRAWLSAAFRTPAQAEPPPPPPQPGSTAVEQDEDEGGLFAPERPWWRDSRVVGGAAVGAVVLIVVLIVAVSALGGSTPTAPSSEASSAPGNGTPSALFSTSPGGAVTSPSTSPSGTPSPVATPTQIPTNSGAISAAPVTQTPTPTACTPLPLSPCPAPT